jgi:hypothetical protein
VYRSVIKGVALEAIGKILRILERILHAVNLIA